MKVGERLTARESASGLRRRGPAGQGPTSTRQALTRFAVARMDEAVVGKVTAGSLVRVKLWTPEGKIVHSDEHRLIGASYPLAMDEQQVLRDNSVEAELSDLSAPENRFERDQGRLLEVYLPVPTPGGDTLRTQAALWAERNGLRRGPS